MNATEISMRLIQVVRELQEAYRLEEKAEQAFRLVEEDVEVKRARKLLIEKAANPKLTGPELAALCTETVHSDRMEAIKKETLYKSAKHHSQVLDRELMALQTLLGMERTRLERGVDFQEG